MIYLAGPYTHPDPHVRHDRFRRLTEVAAKMLAAGINVYSPITHTHPMLEFAELPHTWEFWQKIDREYIMRCTHLLVLTLPEYEFSKGVKAEIEIARGAGIDVLYLDPNHQTGDFEYLVEVFLGAQA